MNTHSRKLISARDYEIEQVKKWAEKNGMTFSKYIIHCAYLQNGKDINR